MAWALPLACAKLGGGAPGSSTIFAFIYFSFIFSYPMIELNKSLVRYFILECLLSDLSM